MYIFLCSMWFSWKFSLVTMNINVSSSFIWITFQWWLLGWNLVPGYWFSVCTKYSVFVLPFLTVWYFFLQSLSFYANGISMCISSVWIWETHKISSFGLIFLRTQSTNKILHWYFKKWLTSQYPITFIVTTENKRSAILTFFWIWLLHYIWLWKLIISGYFWNILSVFTVDNDRLKCGSLWIYLSWNWASWG